MGRGRKQPACKLNWLIILGAAGAISAILNFVLVVILLIVAPGQIVALKTMAMDMINHDIPVMLEREVQKLAALVIEPGPEHQLTPEAKSLLITAGLTLLKPSGSMLPPPLVLDERPGQCPSRSPMQCETAFKTCNAYDVCRSVRTTRACYDFVLDGNELCSMLDCRTYETSAQETCAWVRRACDARLACALNTQSCLAYERSMTRACNVFRGTESP